MSSRPFRNGPQQVERCRAHLIRSACFNCHLTWGCAPVGMEDSSRSVFLASSDRVPDLGFLLLRLLCWSPGATWSCKVLAASSFTTDYRIGAIRSTFLAFWGMQYLRTVIAAGS